ncbi:MAG: translation initiation factor IF-1 [Verrucomicrobiota bacterium]|jgi:translation initiation factor IF-1
MAGKDGIEVEGRIVEVLPRTLFRVELANGHRLLGHVPAARRPMAQALAAGDKVRLRLSPFDLSTGRILQKEQ